jgi:bifunctional DNA-binding transcriptional regulator/antitoxin component of YhaV-PrlF toxin-antitoxin module
MVKLKLKIGHKGQVVLPKIARETRLNLSYVIADPEEDGLTMRRGQGMGELLDWLRRSRKTIARLASKFSLEDEAFEALP